MKDTSEVLMDEKQESPVKLNKAEMASTQPINTDTPSKESKEPPATSETQSNVRVSERLRFKNKLKASKKLVNSRNRRRSHYPPLELESMTIEAGNPAHKLLYLNIIGLIPNYSKEDKKLMPPFVTIRPLPHIYKNKEEEKPSAQDAIEKDNSDKKSLYSDPELGDLDLELMFCPLDIPELYEEITQKPFPSSSTPFEHTSAKTKNNHRHRSIESGYESTCTSPDKFDKTVTAVTPEPSAKIPFYLNRPSIPKKPKVFVARKSTATPPPPIVKLTRLAPRHPQLIASTNRLRVVQANNSTNYNKNARHYYHHPQHVKLNNLYSTGKTLPNNQIKKTIINGKPHIIKLNNKGPTNTNNINPNNMQTMIRHQNLMKNQVMKVIVVNGKKILVRNNAIKSVTGSPINNSNNNNNNNNNNNKLNENLNDVPMIPKFIGIHPILKKPIYRVYSNKAYNKQELKSQPPQQPPSLPLATTAAVTKNPQVSMQAVKKIQKPNAGSSPNNSALHSIMQRLQACGSDIEFVE